MARRVLMLAAVISMVLGLAATPAMAQPANDDLANAEVIGALPFVSTVDTTDATTEVGEPDACLVDVGATVWYAFTPVADNLIIATTYDSDFDTVLTVFDDSLASVVECNDDQRGFQSRVIFAAEAGHTYLLQAGGYYGETGELTLELDVAPPRPANDDRAAATLIGTVPYTDAVNTLYATVEPDEAGCAGIGSTVWYRIEPSVPGVVTIDTFGSDFDTVLGAYVFTDQVSFMLACNDDAKGTLQSELVVPVVPGVEIYIQVGGYAGLSGEVAFNVS